MKFKEVIVQDNIDPIFDEDPIEWMGIDAFHKYWMDVADPRGTYEKTRQDFLFEQAAGSGDWDY